MLSPYDWQENLGHRAQYVEARLAPGLAVAAASCPEGLVLATFGRHGEKISEIYDRIALGALGLQSDIESLRVAAIEFAHQEGFQRAEADVTGMRVVTAVSAPIKRAFADFSFAPFVAKALIAELGETPEEDRAYILDYDGDYMGQTLPAVVSADGSGDSAIVEALRKPARTLAETKKRLQSALAGPEDAQFECAALRRGVDGDRRFVRL